MAVIRAADMQWESPARWQAGLCSGRWAKGARVQGGLLRAAGVVIHNNNRSAVQGL